MGTDQARLYFEAHITIDPVDEEKRAALQELIDVPECRFKLAKLVMDKEGTPSKLDTFCTGHSRSLSDIKSRVVNTVQTLKANGYYVRRWKIEDTLFDSRSGDTLEMMQ